MPSTNDHAYKLPNYTGYCHNPFCTKPLENYAIRYCEKNQYCQLYRVLMLQCAISKLPNNTTSKAKATSKNLKNDTMQGRDDDEILDLPIPKRKIKATKKATKQSPDPKKTIGKQKRQLNSNDSNNAGNTQRELRSTSLSKKLASTNISSAPVKSSAVANGKKKRKRVESTDSESTDQEIDQVKSRTSQLSINAAKTSSIGKERHVKQRKPSKFQRSVHRALNKIQSTEPFDRVLESDNRSKQTSSLDEPIPKKTVPQAHRSVMPEVIPLGKSTDKNISRYVQMGRAPTPFITNYKKPVQSTTPPNLERANSTGSTGYTSASSVDKYKHPSMDPSNSRRSITPTSQFSKPLHPTQQAWVQNRNSNSLNVRTEGNAKGSTRTSIHEYKKARESQIQGEQQPLFNRDSRTALNKQAPPVLEHRPGYNQYQERYSDPYPRLIPPNPSMRGQYSHSFDPMHREPGYNRDRFDYMNGRNNFPIHDPRYPPHDHRQYQNGARDSRYMGQPYEGMRTHTDPEPDQSFYPSEIDSRSSAMSGFPMNENYNHYPAYNNGPPPEDYGHRNDINNRPLHEISSNAAPTPTTVQPAVTLREQYNNAKSEQFKKASSLPEEPVVQFAGMDYFMRDFLSILATFIPNEIGAVLNNTKKARKMRFYLNYIARVEELCEPILKVVVNNGKGEVLLDKRPWMIIKNTSTVGMYIEILTRFIKQGIAWQEIIKYMGEQNSRNTSAYKENHFIHIWKTMPRLHKKNSFRLEQQVRYLYGQTRHHYTYSLGGIDIGSGSHEEKKSAKRIARETSLAFLSSLQLAIGGKNAVKAQFKRLCERPPLAPIRRQRNVERSSHQPSEHRNNIQNQASSTLAERESQHTTPNSSVHAQPSPNHIDNNSIESDRNFAKTNHPPTSLVT